MSEAPTRAPDLALVTSGTVVWAVIAYGVLSSALGIALLVWPRITLAVTVALLSLQFIVTGIVQLARCLGPWAGGAGERAILGVTGALSLLAGLLILRKPLQTLVIVTAIVGACWILRGALDIISSLPGGAPHRAWSIFFGALSLAAGAYVVVNPALSLVTFVLVTAIWMILSGVTVAAAAAILWWRVNPAR